MNGRTDDDRGRPGRLLLQVDSDGISGFTFDYGGLLRVWISAAAPSLLDGRRARQISTAPDAPPTRRRGHACTRQPA
jgi:hypothetical protein